MKHFQSSTGFVGTAPVTQRTRRRTAASTGVGAPEHGPLPPLTSPAAPNHEAQRRAQAAEDLAALAGLQPPPLLHQAVANDAGLGEPLPPLVQAKVSLAEHQEAAMLRRAAEQLVASSTQSVAHPPAQHWTQHNFEPSSSSDERDP